MSKRGKLHGLPVVVFVLTPCAGTAQKNGYSFLDADEPGVHYTRTDAVARTDCESLSSRTNWNYTIVTAEIVAAADGVPEHCRVSGLIPPAIRFQVNEPE